ncbi:MAG TPA: efflux RND transporter periplasmic adaptor subunit, partial [Chthoniobacterales bacterium]|nr:efflux RND transporter periplasmic adaptor subunit [Chthoniobacterales bacterium]
MNKPILSIVFLIGLVLFADRRALAVKPSQSLSEIIDKDLSAPPNDKDKDDDNEKGAKQSEMNQTSPVPNDKDKGEEDEKGTKQNEPKQLGPVPSDKDTNEKEKNVPEKDLKEPEIGRIELDGKKSKNANLEVEVAGPAKIKPTLQLYGKIAMNEDALANVSPRFPGLVKTVSVRLGDRVEKGQVLAIVESNDSLRNYQVTSEIAGTIIKKEVTVGEVVRDDKPIFAVADLSTVWIDFSVFPQDFERVKLGQTVRITYAGNVKPITGKISYIAPIGSENTQSLLARAVAPNSGGLLRPGLFVMGDLETGEIEVPVAVRPDAIQTLNEKTAIFVMEGNAFEAREVKLGARDDNLVQVLSGLNPGDRYVSANSFLLKAEL